MEHNTSLGPISVLREEWQYVLNLSMQDGVDMYLNTTIGKSPTWHAFKCKVISWTEGNHCVLVNGEIFCGILFKDIEKVTLSHQKGRLLVHFKV